MTAPGSVTQRLADAQYVWLSTVRPDGSPHVTPVWFVHVDDRWWIGTGGGAVKVANTRHEPRVSLALEDAAQPVVAEGTTTVHTEAFPGAVVAAFVAKYDWDVSASPGLVLVEVATTRWLMAGAPG